MGSSRQKNHIIIGTAGHVDHGKTCLVKALTGIDTDRLKEEKKRGITIELGFAYLPLPNQELAGIVDVPGHEKFIKHMLAGAGGIDIAILVVAADEGVMPQTIEHLEILSLLDLKYGVVALTKTDGVDEELCEIVEEDVKELVEHTFLEGAAIVRTSAYDGTGMKELREELYRLAEAADKKKVQEPFRLPIDRVFTMRGFGTVVTGTLVEGTLSANKEVMLYPGGERAKIRSLQVHGKEVEQVYAGQRAAINLSNVKKEEIFRGEILAACDSLEPTRMVDVKLKMLKNTDRKVKNGSRVHLYHGSRELLCKVVLLDEDILEAGQEGYAQLRLEESDAFKTGDHFVIRFYSPLETVGGGIILDSNPKKLKRMNPKIHEAMAVKERGTARERLELAILEYGESCLSVQVLARRAGMDWGRAANDLRALREEGKVAAITSEVYFHKVYLERLQNRVTIFLDSYHQSYPLKEGMPMEEVRSRLNLPGEVADGVLDYLYIEKVIKNQGGLLSCFRFRVVRRTDDKILMEQLVELYKSKGFQPPSNEELKANYASEKNFPHVFSAMIVDKTLIRLDDKHYLLKEFYEKALEGLYDLWREKGRIILGEYRDRLEISRKHAVSLLEIFDKNGITRKRGDERMLKK